MTPGRVMALDVGERRIGVAISDPLRITVRGLTTIDRARADACAAVVDSVAQWAPVCVVIGDPRLPSGDRGEQAESTDAFVARLAPELARLGVPIARWDESYTSEAAIARLRARGVDTRRDKAAIDAEAAAIILEEWLRSQA